MRIAFKIGNENLFPTVSTLRVHQLFMKDGVLYIQAFRFRIRRYLQQLNNAVRCIYTKEKERGYMDGKIFEDYRIISSRQLVRAVQEGLQNSER